MDLEQRAAREFRRDLARQSILFFAATYLRDEDDLPYKFKDFHVQMMENAASDLPDDTESVDLIPAANGKTTILSFIYPLWLLCASDPNARLALVGKTYEDAKARLRAIKVQMESNDLLITDFGPFTTTRWTDDEIEVAQRTTNAKDPSIKIFGAGMSVFGWRATHVVCDDIVTIQNSGSNVREETRKALRDNYFQGIRKMGGPGKQVRIRWAQTVVDLRDLVHEVADLRNHADEETDWITDHGVKVTRRRALNEETGEVLWPERYTRAELESERAIDPISFMRRMQNRCIEPGMMTFQKEWFGGNGSDLPGCYDRERVIGQIPRKDGADWVTVAGFDPNFGLSDKAKWCGWITLAFDKNAPLPRPYHIIEIAQFRSGIEEQADFVISGHSRSRSALTLIERNASNQWLVNMEVFKKAVKSGARIEPYWTSVRSLAGYDPDLERPDPQFGLPAMAGLIRGGMLRFPYGDDLSREKSNLLIGEMESHPMSQTTDLLMATWFATIAARRLSKSNRLQVVRRALPSWATGFHMNPPGPRGVIQR